MKPSKKKPAKKSIKSKSLRGTSVKKRATTKKTVQPAGEKKTGRTRAKSSEGSGLQTKILHLTRQLKLKERKLEIEAALEKVRSRSIAMRQSSELGDLSFELVKQVQALGIATWHCAFNIYDEGQERSTEWGSNANGSYPIYKTPREGIFRRYYEVGQQGATLHVEVIGEDRCADHYAYLCTLPGVGDTLIKVRDSGIPFPKSQIDHVAYFKYGYLLFITFVPAPEAHDVFKRFAKVFEQTYTRFLDLQQAEAQTREAQIQLALERVRARTMAMQKSDELREVVATLYEQLSQLNFDSNACNIIIIDNKTNNQQYWVSGFMQKLYPESYNVPYFEHSYIDAQLQSWKQGKKYTVIEYSGKTKKEFDKQFFSQTEFKNIPQDVQEIIKTFESARLSTAFFTYGALQIIGPSSLSDENAEILQRFASVFDQTYTRFLDLQKAEAQAREAQVEAALEKVRSRSLAMHKSDEVALVVDELFLRMKDLEIGFDSVNILEFTDDAFQIWAAYQPGKFTVTKIPFTKSDIPYVRSAVEAKNSGKQLFTHQYAFEEKNVFLKYLFEETHFKNLPDERKQFLLQCPCYTVSIGFAKNTAIQLQSYSRAAFSESENSLLKRFVKVFEQAYTRFLDLQRAEAQAREAQIEAALERVRSRTMAMQKSDELTDVAGLLFKQVTDMGIKTWTAGFNVWSEDNNSYVDYITSPNGGFIEPYTIDATQASLLTEVSDARKSGVEFFVQYAEGERLKEAYLALSKFGDQKQYEIMLQGGFQFPSHQYDHFVFGSKVSLMFITYDSVTEAHEIFKRFGKVFEQTYTRFLDLQKAEAQTREAQIETALEKVRSASLAMHRSDELEKVVSVLFEKLAELGLSFDGAMICLFDKGKRNIQIWIATKFLSTPIKVDLPYNEDFSKNSIVVDLWRAIETSEHVLNKSYTGKVKDDYFRYTAVHNESQIPVSVREFHLQAESWTVTFAAEKNSIVGFDSWTGHITLDADFQTLKRFSRVFEQCYTRFLDLKKSEAQAREAKIENALEKVRSRTMAMQRSEEIADIVGRIFRELTLLDVALNRVLIWIFNSDEKYFSWWSANPEAERNAESYRVDYNEHPVFLTYYEGWKKRTPLLLYTLGDDVKASWEDHLFKNTELARLPKAVQDGMRSEKQIFTTSAISDFGLLMAGCFEPFSDEVNDIIQRFGRVFQQSYTRYVDVQNAEAQAREATIEASLEKVRGKAMGMHNSNDLASTASLVFTELRKLGIDSFRNGVGLLTKENRNVKLYSATSSEEGGSFSVVGWAVLDHHPVLSKTYDSWVNNEDFFPLLKGEMLKSYYDKIAATFTVPVEQSEGYEQHGYFLPFSEGLFYGWSEKPFTETEIKILNRFRGIVDLTFRRYMELQKSEASAKEAIRQASLDRVRAEIASMRTTTDLDRITPLIWKELNILNIPFVRCGVFIMDELQQQMHTFLSTPDGKAIAAFHLPFDSPGNVGQILSHWQNKQMYIAHWDETAFSELGEILVQQRAIPSKEIYMSTVPGGGVYLHCLPFLQGMLYVGNTTELQEEDIHMIQSVADAFSTAYARYEDFNKLESAKAQIEKTFTDLKQTQNLLVQSEKMASLGELTAGIAHEIQNPLNFVNNFSEVTNELLEEMKEEIEKGNYDEVQAITNNIKQNLEKILHHGKRADGIVKGMLQHSRSSTGVTEPTDINALADEYLRLAYHGFRAKDKSFSASTNTDLDRSIGNINVVPQDIGRVILNLITNAFFAVAEKQKHAVAGYQPAVSLSTKRHEDRVLISVKDNGNGIPKQIREKIFQPFFTTKPTGQGTGLGLSLSYDIVKAHGGDLTVETMEGEGSEFIVSIMDT